MAGEYESWPVFLLYQYILEFCISYCETSDTHHFHSQATGLYRAPVRVISEVLILIATRVDCLLLDIVENLLAIHEQGVSCSYPDLWILTLLEGRTGCLHVKS